MGYHVEIRSWSSLVVPKSVALILRLQMRNVFETVGICQDVEPIAQEAER